MIIPGISASNYQGKGPNHTGKSPSEITAVELEKKKKRIISLKNHRMPGTQKAVSKVWQLPNALPVVASCSRGSPEGWSIKDNNLCLLGAISLNGSGLLQHLSLIIIVPLDLYALGSTQMDCTESLRNYIQERELKGWLYAWQARDD